MVAFTTSADLYQAFLYVEHHRVTQATEPTVSERLLARLWLIAIHTVIHSQTIDFTQPRWQGHMLGKYLWYSNAHGDMPTYSNPLLGQHRVLKGFTVFIWIWFHHDDTHNVNHAFNLFAWTFDYVVMHGRNKAPYSNFTHDDIFWIA